MFKIIIAIDIETEGLDATKYITGCIWKEGRKKSKFYRTKEELWKEVLRLGYNEAKKGKVLNIYSHNASYDTAGYVNLKDKHLVFFCNKPFIWAYRLTKEECQKENIPHEKGKGKEIIKFLDTWAIFRMSLKKVGNIINLKKIETPIELLTKIETEPFLKEIQLKKIEHYCARDTEIVLKSIMFLKKLIKNEGLKIKRLYTINQIAINYLMYHIKKLPDKYLEPLLWDKKKGQVRQTYRKEEIHEAYRGGRVEAFKTGIYNNVTYIDCNSLYPYSAINIKFPNLKSERKHYEPLKTGWTLKEITETIGLSKCLIKNETDEYGLLPIRTETGSYYPKKGKLMIGTWTNLELKEAINNGYKIINIEWMISYKEAPNPLTQIFPMIYKKRKENNNPFNNYFYKMMMNASIGKLAQHRTGQEIILDNVEKCEEYLEKNYKVIKGIGTDYMYKLTKKEGYTKPYYVPIVPCLINAYARVYMYKYYKKVPKKDILYTDTDSIIFKGNHTKNFPITNKLGDFKIEYNKEKTIIYGRKTYSIGKEIKISGFTLRNALLEDFEKGYISTQKMITINTTNDTNLVGTFKTEKRDLITQEENHNIITNMLEKQEILIDNNITDIKYFLKDIKRYT